MARSVIAETIEAGNASDVTVFTMPVSYAGFIGNIFVTNTTGSTPTITLKVTRTSGVTYTILNADAMDANGINYYGRGATKCLVPLTLNAGESLLAQGSSAGIHVTVSGLRFSIS
ncbi:MAG: hypothetical protein QXH80_00060 [Candidatus Nanoarchaeia archaeon]